MRLKEKRSHIKESEFFFFFTENTNLNLHEKYGATDSGCLKMQ